MKKQTKKYLYFAYGSNLNMEQMAARCPRSKPMYKAILPNAKLVFKTYADVIINKSKKPSYVHGAVYEITEKCMRALDAYEGFPSFYKKVKCVVQIANTNEYAEVFMYVMQPRVRRPALPTNEYFNVCYQGYLNWNINPWHITQAWDTTATKLGLYEEETKQ